jgi:methylenetetrahydrofolate reductase (NADPH)
MNPTVTGVHLFNSSKGNHMSITTVLAAGLPPIGSCPKSMVLGPCGGVSADGGCEVDAAHSCVFLDPVRAARRDEDERAALGAALAPDPAALSASGFRQRLESGAFTVVTELNGPDGAAADSYVAAAQAIAAESDAVSVTDHSGANVHMGSLAAAGRLRAAGIEVIATFACRDRNRIALQGDLLGAASLGIGNVLCVTGNHVLVGDSPDARAVFDLDGSRLIGLADRLRKRGVYDNGRALTDAPALFLGGPAHPFAPPYEERPRHVIRKARLGADFIISQHIFDLTRWRGFVRGVQELRGEPGVPGFHLLGGIAILPDGGTARQVNAGLRGFSIPEAVLRRLDQAGDPQQAGIDIAAETLAELSGQPGVAGCLLAPVVNRGSNALTASAEQADVIRAVRERAGVSAGAA